MEEKDVYRAVEDIDTIMREPLREVIVEYLIKDDQYCEKLDICLNRVKDKNGNVYMAYPMGPHERFVRSNYEERKEWIFGNYYNASRGYVINTFTYYWLHKLLMKGKYENLDAGWRNSLDLYFGEEDHNDYPGEGNKLMFNEWI